MSAKTKLLNFVVNNLGHLGQLVSPCRTSLPIVMILVFSCSFTIMMAFLYIFYIHQLSITVMVTHSCKVPRTASSSTVSKALWKSTNTRTSSLLYSIDSSLGCVQLNGIKALMGVHKSKVYYKTALLYWLLKVQFVFKSSVNCSCKKFIKVT